MVDHELPIPSESLSLPSTTMEQSSDSIIETRQDHMVSSTGSPNPTPILRSAHFLKPSVGSSKGPVFDIPSDSLSSLPPSFEPGKWPLSITFLGWRHPQRKWREWVDRMAPLHQSTWKKAGIFEAVLNSTYDMHRNNDLVLGVAERWCPETNSFLFPWGEATITLEDVMMIAGYSVLGCSVVTPLETSELKEVLEKMIHARKELRRTAAKKACQYMWMRNLMATGSEIEHEAFLAFWLSRFVLPTSFNVICESIFPIAVHLARGIRVALAPAVLASTYRDLSLLKGKIVALTKTGTNNTADGDGLAVTIWSPFQLVQAWIWERFVQLGPKPNLIGNGEPRLARWHNLRHKPRNVRMLLASAEGLFTWRPYAKAVENTVLPKFYGETEMWVCPDLCFNEEFLSFAGCLRVFTLVGLDCTENYFPHRVARQFGFDQDLACCIGQLKDCTDSAWREQSIYIPSRTYEGCVTTRYMEWWKESMKNCEGAREGSTLPGGRKSKDLKEKTKRYKCLSTFKITPKVKSGSTEKCFSSSKIMPVNLKESKAHISVKRSRIVAKNHLQGKKTETISSFRISPKRSNGMTDGNSLISNFKIISKRSKERIEGASVSNDISLERLKKLLKCPKRKSNCGVELVPTGNPSKQSKMSENCPSWKKKGNDFSGSPMLSHKSSKESAEASKRKKKQNDACSHSSPVTISERSDLSSKRKKCILDQSSYELPKHSFKRTLEENSNSPSAACSLKTTKSLSSFSILINNNSPVPPGFPPKSNSVTSRESGEEGMTIAEILKSHKMCQDLNNEQRGCIQNSSSLACSDPSSVVNNGAVTTVDPLPKSLEKSPEFEVVSVLYDGTVNIVGPLAKSLDKSAELECEATELRLLNSGETSHSHNLSSIPHNETLKHLESVSAAVEKVQHVEATQSTEGGNPGNPSGQCSQVSTPVADEGSLESLVRLTTATVESERLSQFVNLSNNGSVSCSMLTAIGIGKDTRYTFELPGLELEAQIVELEKKIAKLKAARFRIR